MRALVAYESMFGDTRAIAEAVADGLRAADVEVALFEVGVASPEPDDDVALRGRRADARAEPEPAEPRRSASESGWRRRRPGRP